MFTLVQINSDNFDPWWLIFNISSTFNRRSESETFELDWERTFSLPFKITLDIKLREIQYKILPRICYANFLLFKFGLAVSSPLCHFCNKELETLEHFFFIVVRLAPFGVSYTVFSNHKSSSLKTFILYIFYRGFFLLIMMMTAF